jgi:hypothetical protein
VRPTRRSLLLSGAAASLMAGRARAGGADPSAPKYLVVVFANGGWDVSFSVDPKPRVDGGPVDGPWVDESANPADREERRVIAGIPVQCNDFKRPAVTNFFETFGPRACVVNGIWTGSIVHQPSRIRIFTGTQEADRADFATIVGVEKGHALDLPLGTIDFSGLGYAGDYAASTGRIGNSSQLKALLDPESTFPAPSWADYTLPLAAPTSVQEEAIQAHLRARVAAYRGGVGDGGGNNDRRLDDMLESYGRRDRLLASADVIAGRLELGSQPSLELQADVAVDLLAAGVCHTVTLADTVESWDTHDLNHLQHEQYQALFSAVGRLAQNLIDAGLFEQTLVVVMSEMTRTPKLNWKTGKDHWPHTSQIWLGAGVRGGTVVGATDESLQALPVDFATGVAGTGELNKYDNLAAGLLLHMGVDPEPYLPGVDPFTAASASAG